MENMRVVESLVNWIFITLQQNTFALKQFYQRRKREKPKNIKMMIRLGFFIEMHCSALIRYFASLRIISFMDFARRVPTTLKNLKTYYSATRCAPSKKFWFALIHLSFRRTFSMVRVSFQSFFSSWHWLCAVAMAFFYILFVFFSSSLIYLPFYILNCLYCMNAHNLLSEVDAYIFALYPEQ